VRASGVRTDLRTGTYLLDSSKLERGCVEMGRSTRDRWPPVRKEDGRRAASMKGNLGCGRRAALGLTSATAGALPLPTTSCSGEPSEHDDEQDNRELQSNQFGRSDLAGLE
jgi:hypothetical protein